MRRILTLLLLTTLVTSAPLAHAQDVVVTDFEPFDGLERGIARMWMAPLTLVGSESGGTFNEEGTPVTEWRSRPLATPEPQSGTGIGLFSVAVFLFDNDEHAATGLQSIDDDVRETMRRDPRAPGMGDLPLDGIGDQATGSLGELTQDGITLTYTFATVQDGPFVYFFVIESAGVDTVTLVQKSAESLVRAPMNRMAERHDPDGGSEGGIWSKLTGVQPDMPEESTVHDLILYPSSQATPETSFRTPPRLDITDPLSIASLDSIDHVTYTDGADATPSPERSGVFRIDAWRLTFDSDNAAGAAALPLGNTLIEPFGITSGGSGVETNGQDSIQTAIYEGFIDDRSLPPGKGVVLIRQEGAVVVAVVVYAIEADPRPVAEAILPILMEGNFPDEDDPVLHGLTRSSSPIATPAS